MELRSNVKDTLLIRGEKDSDGGIFGCQAENTVGRSPVMETHVIIAGMCLHDCITILIRESLRKNSEPPTFVSRPPPELRAFEGTSVNVTCDAYGDPLPIVYWVHSEVSAIRL